MSEFDGFKSPEASSAKQVFVNAYDPGTGRTTSMRGTGDSMANVNADLVNKGYLTNLQVVDNAGSGQGARATGYSRENLAADQAGQKNVNLRQGPDNRAVEGTESGSKPGRGHGIEQGKRIPTGSEPGNMHRHPSGVGPDNRAVDGSESGNKHTGSKGIPNKSAETGADNRKVPGSEHGHKPAAGPENRPAGLEGGLMKVPGPHNRAVPGSEQGNKNHAAIGPDNRAQGTFKDAALDVAGDLFRYGTPVGAVEHVYNQVRKAFN